MVFSIIIILFIGVIAYFHFVQGFFSATLSAMISVIAAVLAVSYHETVVNLLLKGKMADMAHGMMLCAIFAITYTVLRTIFDAAIHGNVRTPTTVDKVGGAVMGIVCGVFATGIFAIAVQTLPFGPSISFMGAPRYVVRDNNRVTVPVLHGSFLDSKISEQMDENALNEKQTHLLLPVDDWVLDTVYHLSDGGSLAGDRSLASVHPDYLQELFGERLGIQTGARRSALYSATNQSIDIKGVYSLPSLPAKDGGLNELRQSTYQPIIKLDKEGNGLLKPIADQRILIVRVKLNGGVTDDDDHLFRFSCGSIHLVGKTQGGYKDFYPIGTLEGKIVLLNSPDDFLFVKEGSAFDAVFLVDQSLLTPSTNKNSNKIVDGTFVTIKRFAHLDLGSMEVKENIPSDSEVQMVRHPVLPEQRKLALAPAQTTSDNTPPPPVTPTPVAPPVTPATPATPDVPAGPQTLPGKEVASSIKATVGSDIMVPGFRGIGVNTADATATDTAVAGGTISFGKSGITVAKIDPTAELTKLGEGTSSQTQFSVPADRVAVQVTMHPYTTAWDDWMSQIGTTKLVDSNGNSYPPNGCYALAKAGTGSGLMLRFDVEHTNFSVVSPDGALDGDVYYVFLIPKDTELKSFKLGGKTQDLDSSLHVQ